MGLAGANTARAGTRRPSLRFWNRPQDLVRRIGRRSLLDMDKRLHELLALRVVVRQAGKLAPRDLEGALIQGFVRLKDADMPQLDLWVYPNAHTLFVHLRAPVHVLGDGLHLVVLWPLNGVGAVTEVWEIQFIPHGCTAHNTPDTENVRSE